MFFDRAVVAPWSCGPRRPKRVHVDHNFAVTSELRVVCALERVPTWLAELTSGALARHGVDVGVVELQSAFVLVRQNVVHAGSTGVAVAYVVLPGALPALAGGLGHEAACFFCEESTWHAVDVGVREVHIRVLEVDGLVAPRATRTSVRLPPMLQA